MEQKNSKKKSMLKNALLVAGGAAVGILVYNNRAKIGGAMKSAYSSIKTRMGKKCDTVGAIEQPQVTAEVKAPTEVHEVSVSNSGNMNNNGERFYKPRYENNNNKFNNN